MPEAQERAGKSKYKLIKILCAATIAVLFFTMLGAYTIQAHAAACPSGGEHDYSVELIRQATDDEDGLRTYTCKKCGESYDEIIPKTGHDWTEWSVVKEPGCRTQGLEERHCRKCGAEQERAVSATGHDYELTVVQEQSCTDDGIYRYKCKNCGESYEESEPALDHVWSEWYREGDREVRICGRDSSHREERAVAASPEEDPTEDEPEEKMQSIEKTKELPDVPSPENEEEPKEKGVQKDPPEIKIGGVAKETDVPTWTVYNTAVAAGGSLLLLGLGAALFTLYITPWLWIYRRRREKRNEMQRRMSRK